MMHGLYVFQQNNEYQIWTPQGELIAHIKMPYDAQFMKDAMTLKPMCKIIGKRWGVNPNSDE